MKTEPESPGTQFNPKSLHQQILSSSASPEAHDFIIGTDGSGWQDGYCGSAAMLLSPKHQGVISINFAGSTGSTVERAEFEALLMGLQMILDAMGWQEEESFEVLRRNPPSVFWISDRESLVLCVHRNQYGEPTYRRRTCQDLWRRFEFYEEMFHITPIFSPRMTHAVQNIADRLASEMRVIIKNYAETLKQDEVIPTCPPKP